jgi:hypothetical protein
MIIRSPHEVHSHVVVLTLRTARPLGSDYGLSVKGSANARRKTSGRNTTPGSEGAGAVSGLYSYGLGTGARRDHTPRGER